MPEQLALEARPEQPVAISPMEMIQSALQAAINQGQGIEVYDRLLERMERQREYEDRTQFNAALQRIQTKLGVVVKDADSPRGKYASAKAIDKAIGQLCNDENIVLSFNTEETQKPDTVRLVCDVSMKRSGYSRRFSLEVPADGSGPKGGGVMNRTQAVGSAVTSGKRYLKNMIFNLRIQDVDDNGQSAGGVGLSEKVLTDWIDHIKASATTGELTARYIQGLKIASTENDKRSMEDAATARKKELAK